MSTEERKAGITRDAGFPVEAANLMAMFNQCCEGHDCLTVLQAAANMLSAAINTTAIVRALDDKQHAAYADTVLQKCRTVVQLNWKRIPDPADIPVKASPAAPPIDYRDLLRRYIEHVGNVEGVTFLSCSWARDLRQAFSPEEINILRGLDT